MKRILTVLTIALLSSACTSSRVITSKLKQVVLYENVNEEGETLTYALVAQSHGIPTITRRQRQKFVVASLGLRARSINRELAESMPVRGLTTEGDQATPPSVTPWSGLLVKRVDRDSPAALADIQVGDILLSLDGTAMSSSEQLKETLEAFAEPGSVVTLTVLKLGQDQVYGTQPMELSVALGTKRVEVTKSDTIEVDSDVGVYHLTGLQVCTLPAEISLEIYGHSDPVTLVADSLVGSPAYLAGLRGGDRVMTCEGQAVTSYADVSRAVLARSRRDEVPASWFGAAARAGVTETDGKIALSVDGPLGPYETSLKVIHDIDDSSRTYIPIVYDYHSDVDSTSWSFLDFILQFGANYRTRYRESSTRAPKSDSYLSLLPFGMFEFESTAHSDRCEFFWFIEFEDRH